MQVFFNFNLIDSDQDLNQMRVKSALRCRSIVLPDHGYYTTTGSQSIVPACHRFDLPSQPITGMARGALGQVVVSDLSSMFSIC